MADLTDVTDTDQDIHREAPTDDAGFIKFYGLYWRKDAIAWDEEELLGKPDKWVGKGKIAKDFDRKRLQMNFWKQKGVYVLYDSNLHPVYAGQAGLTRKKPGSGQHIGDRLASHSKGIYRHGWSIFSWFGFLDTEKIALKETSEDIRFDPEWKFNVRKDGELNLLLASFEAILIEGFAPRFNARGGDLGKAVIVDQYDP